MKQISSHHKIQSRIMYTTLSCLLVMCFFVSIVSFGVFYKYLNDSLIKTSTSSLMILADSIDSDISDITRIVRFCQTNSAISDYIKNCPNPGSKLSVSTHDRLTEEFNNNPSKEYIERLAIISTDSFLQIVSATHSSSKNLALEVPKLDFYDELINANGFLFSTGFINDPFHNCGTLILPIIRPITYQFNSITAGALFMEVNSTLFTNSFSKYIPSEGSSLYLSIESHNYIFENGQLIEIEELPERLVSVDLSLSGCKISQSISSSAIRNDLTLLLLVLFFVLLLIITIGAVMMAMLNRMISVPVKKLRKRMGQVSLGDFERDSSVEWDTELGEIGRGINDMAANIEQLLNNIVEDEKQKKDLEYKVLQSQINPHFIYNTLNSIKWMATVQGANGISEMTTALAKLLKSISKGTSSIVTIDEELNLLKDYFTIQNYRYGGTITLNVSIENEDLKKYGIVKFTLQPIVENAIFHGIEPKGSGTIDVSVNYEKNGICISVYDDGVGMNQEKIDSLFAEEAKSSSDFFKELGVSNVHKRLQYIFGKEYGITVESQENEYTIMCIHIPMKEV